MSIPTEAVEAALLAMRGLNFYDYNDAGYIRAALEAAAPYMLAEAWEQGRDAEFQRSVMKRQADPNPYRTPDAR